jgi:asparagine N-glycosylation enzyme membrane subunit Stt3
VAFARIAANPLGVLNLAVEKFRMLWGNDDYGETWTALCLGQQGNLTPGRQNLIDWFTRFNDAFYLFALFFSGVFGLTLFRRRKMQPAHVLILLFVGTAMLHMFLESQNRYHYFVLPIFVILAALGIGEVYQGAVRRNRQD